MGDQTTEGEARRMAYAVVYKFLKDERHDRTCTQLLNEVPSAIKAQLIESGAAAESDELSIVQIIMEFAYLTRLERARVVWSEHVAQSLPASHPLRASPAQFMRLFELFVSEAASFQESAAANAGTSTPASPSTAAEAPKAAEPPRRAPSMPPGSKRIEPKLIRPARSREPAPSSAEPKDAPKVVQAGRPKASREPVVVAKLEPKRLESTRKRLKASDVVPQEVAHSPAPSAESPLLPPSAGSPQLPPSSLRSPDSPPHDSLVSNSFFPK